MKKFLTFLIIILTVALSGCSTEQKTDKLTVAVSIAPQAHFAEKICGDSVNIITLIPAGASAESFEMKPKDVISFSKAHIYFSIGVPAEENGILPNISDGTKLARLDKAVSEAYPDLKIGNERDPHIWLSPKRAILMVETMTKELCTLSPQNKDIFLANSKKYVEELKKLQSEIQNLFKDKRKKSFLISHPSYGYFASDFGLEMISLEKNGQEATPKQLESIITLAKTQEVKYIFCQEEASKKQADLVAKEIGGKVETLRPLAKAYETSLKETANLIYQAVN